MFGININLIIYFIIFLIVSYGAYTLYGTITDNARLNAIVIQQEAALKNQQKTIELQKQTEQIKNDIILERDKNIDELNTRLQDIASDLGKDSTDQAPESIKELFRRLK